VVHDEEIQNLPLIVAPIPVATLSEKHSPTVLETFSHILLPLLETVPENLRITFSLTRFFFVRV